MNMKKFLNIAAMLCLLAATQAACTEDSPVTNPRQPEPEKAERGTFAKGADVSWLTQMESEGLTFLNKQGDQTELMSLLKDDCGVNAIRLRVWVNPAEGWNNIDDVLAKARRADALGLRLMIDFHFSDTWADPAHQATPEAWESYDLAQLKTAVADHVTEMLARLNTYGVEPEWVQIGNETRAGMLYPIGNIDQGGNFAQLVNAGYDAVKAIFPDCQVIVHVDSGDNLWLFNRLFGNLKDNGGKYDLIGMSLYPANGESTDYINKAVSNISTLYDTYGKNVIVCEIGMDYTEAEECRDAIAQLMEQGQATGHLDGIFYWEPEAPAGYNGGYKKGCFDGGQPTVALDAFLPQQTEE